MTSTMIQPKLLSSWKEIAALFGKGVRTVQRWEAWGLPVHRPTGESHIVFAQPDELQQWALSQRKFVGQRKHGENDGLLVMTLAETPLTSAMRKHLGRELTGGERKLLALAEQLMEHEKQLPAQEAQPQTASD
jgi:phage terminase Nu1 subunit (DNA packaging protein)